GEMTMAELAPVHQQILRAQPMHGDEPGTVLRDVETLLAFMGDNTPTVSAKHHLLPMGTLAPLNAQMTHPMQLSLQRPQQRTSAYIHALNLLLRATGLASITGTGNKSRLALDEDGLASWRHRNPTERDLTLVETWLLRAQPESIAERLGSCRSPLADWAGFCRRIPDNDLRIAGNQREEERLVYVPGHLTVALLELFGFVTVHHGTPEPDT